MMTSPAPSTHLVAKRTSRRGATGSRISIIPTTRTEATEVFSGEKPCTVASRMAIA